MGIFDKFLGGLKKTRDGFSNAVTSVFSGFTKIDEELFEELLEILIMSDVGVTTAESICDELRSKVKKQGVKDPMEVKNLLKETIRETLEDEEKDFLVKPTVMLIIGVNGVGKTTTIGKIASNLKAEGKKVILGAADTFRAAATEQLSIWAERADVDIVKHSEGADPAAVVFDTLKSAKAKGADVVLIDTAGRLHNKKNLMAELEKINRVIDREAPDFEVERLLVLDATTGQNAVNQAREFNKVTKLTGIILTKLDGTAKGGVVLSIREELKLPVKYIGVGEGIDDLQPFNAEFFTDALFAEE